MLAVWAVFVLFEPLVDASVAEQLLALGTFALHGIVDGVFTDQAHHVAGYVVIEVSGSVYKVFYFIGGAS